jgi:hypothetical protein
LSRRVQLMTAFDASSQDFGAQQREGSAVFFAKVLGELTLKALTVLGGGAHS